MITAQQAAEIAKAGDKEVDRILLLLEKEIEAKAKLGEREYKCYKHVSWEALGLYDEKKPSPLQERLITELKKYGFAADMRLDGESYVPRGLADDDGNGPEHWNSVLVIKW